ncbi:MAG: HEAT repeat domain-containing protein [Nitrospirae bacterium]|nr:HEAT repeat domain-containing protein [Nitrospirota bacterium]
MSLFGPNVEKLKDKKDIQGLIKTLKNDDVRMKAALALIEIKDPGSVEPLIATLKDENQEISVTAAMILAQIGEPAIKPLIIALKDRNSNVRLGAARALGLIGGILLSALENKDNEARKNVVETLERLDSVTHLIAMLKDTSIDFDVRENIVMALANKVDQAVDSLIITLKDEAPNIRSSAAGALGELKDLVRNLKE